MSIALDLFCINVEATMPLAVELSVLIRVSGRVIYQHKHVLASAAKAEFVGLFHNGQTAVPL